MKAKPTKGQPRCLSGEVVSGRRRVEGGAILETDHFHAHQDVAYPIPGLVILALCRHVRGLDELTAGEATDLTKSLRRLRRAQRDALGIDSVYYFCNEDTTHHFHVWMVPRYPWMDDFGRSVESLRPVLIHARENMASTENLESVRAAVRKLRVALSG